MYVYLFLINAVSFALMLADKAKARKKKWRIPERTFLFLALAGGSVGIIVGMNIARHKTKHASFTIGVPCIFAMQLVILLFFIMNK